MFGLNYNKVWAEIQFWLLFIAVNVIFLPMHFLGLNGMPRRIPLYPDSFTGWNYVSSIGSISRPAQYHTFTELPILTNKV